MTNRAIAFPVILLLIFWNLTISAQRLPNIQQTGLRAPAGIKIDGKATEWDNKFQAYNKATDVFYTIANDDDNLYLTIQTPDPDVIHKIVNGRISFTINKSGKKNEDDAVVISYPIFDRKDRPALSYRNKPKFITGSATSLKQADSIMYLNNKRMNEKAKLIKVTGVKGLDTLISAYNEDGIKAAAAFDNQVVYTCEIAVALKVIGLTINDPAKFSYNVRLNGLAFDDIPGINVTRAPNGTIIGVDINRKDMTPGSQGLGSPTDFWGEYTLVKK